MNRTTAILLALGILLAHSLSIHRDYQWRFAGPFDQVHVAFALGESLAQGDGLYLSDAEDAPGLQAYPSPLWVGMSAVAKALGRPVPRVAQMVDLLAALLLLSLSTRIAYNRVAGVIPPLLLVLSGTMASGAVCGTEHVVMAFFIVAAFVAFEKNHPRWFALFLALTVATRAEGMLLMGGWFLFWLAARRQSQNKRTHPIWVFLPALLLAAIFCIYTPKGEPYPLYLEVFHSAWTQPQWQQGFNHLRDFVIVAVSPLLALLGVVFLLAGRLSGTGIRALALSLAWVVWMVMVGGETYPFGLAFLPVLPLICLVIQETIVAALDTYRPSMEAASWVTLFLTAFAAASASRFPGDVGPLKLLAPQTRWLQSTARVPLGEDSTLGRTQLHSEIRNSLQMRVVSEFFGAFVPPGLRILTPWPGHLSYQTGLDVEDWFTRMRSVPGQEKRFSAGTTVDARLDLALASHPDVVLPGIVLGAPMLRSTLPNGINPRLLGMAPQGSGVAQRVLATMESEYRLASLPITHPAVGYALPYFVYLKRSESDLPKLDWQAEGSSWNLNVEMGSGPMSAMPRMVDLVVTGTDQAGLEYQLTPFGEWVPKSEGASTLLNV
ncbi:MAG TPA: hypothetical protein PLJ12_10145, partial [Planctomycetota bacterium]|nr:hypothetical protein [Planctomycetota bacterium]